MSQFKKYRESVRAPITVRLLLSFFIGLLFLGGLTLMMYPATNRELPAFFPSIVFAAVVGALAFILTSLFYKVSIRISKRMMASSAKREVTLRISGVNQKGSSYIQCKDIKALAVRPYSIPGSASINPFRSRHGDEGEYIVALPGFKGEGILLTYTYETFFSHKEKDNSILFPTNNAKRLHEILKDIIGKPAARSET